METRIFEEVKKEIVRAMRRGTVDDMARCNKMFCEKKDKMDRERYNNMSLLYLKMAKQDVEKCATEEDLKKELKKEDTIIRYIKERRNVVTTKKENTKETERERIWEKIDELLKEINNEKKGTGEKGGE